MKKKVKKKAKKKFTTGKLKKKLWTVFSRFIRIRDKGKCFTCNIQKPWTQMQAGHFIPKSTGGLALYFHVQNVHCQCFRCNINLGGNGAIYAKRIKDVYGEEKFDELLDIHYNGCRKLTIFDYEKLIKIYEAKEKELLLKYNTENNSK